MAAPAGVGVEIANNPSTTYAATVTMLDTIQVAANVTGATSSLAGTSPPDPAGAEGDGRVAVMVDGLYNVYNTSGQEVLSESLTKFWTNAGATVAGTPFSSRIVYDTYSNQWVAIALDTVITNGVEQASNNILIAVSDGSDPTGRWTAFTLASTSATSGAAPTTAYATSVALGIDELAANITVDLSNLTETLITIPSASLFPVTGTPGDGGFTAIPNVTQPSNTSTELSVQPTTNLFESFTVNNFQATNVLLGIDENIANTIDRFDVETEGATQVTAIVAGPTPISVSPALLANPVGAAQPGTSVTIDTGSDAFPASLYEVGNDIWAVQTVADPTSGNSDIQWFEISYSTNAILQHGLISDPNLSFYDPSVAANLAGQVVIGFNGSGTNQFVSAYAVMGTTTSGVTAFTTPILLKQGVADYDVPVANPTGGAVSNPWGNYSETVVGGDNTANTFWTFQEYASGKNQWSEQFFEITFGVPTQTQPTVTLSASGGVLQREWNKPGHRDRDPHGSRLHDHHDRTRIHRFGHRQHRLYDHQFGSGGGQHARADRHSYRLADGLSRPGRSLQRGGHRRRDGGRLHLIGRRLRARHTANGRFVDRRREPSQYLDRKPDGRRKRPRRRLRWSSGSAPRPPRRSP